MKIRFPIAIERGNANEAWGVVVPDLVGCYSAGDSYGDALVMAKEAIETMCEVLKEEGKDIPEPSRIDDHIDGPDWSGWLWAYVEIET
ncbi:type II toxin-antitoxin system HicB family antitoxin [Vibrio mediterranei]